MKLYMCLLLGIMEVLREMCNAIGYHGMRNKILRLANIRIYLYYDNIEF